MNDTKAKILVVDDDPILLELLVETLTTIGYDTGEAVDGLDALEILKKDKFDLMISDIKMPNLDGIGLLKEVRKLYPDLPVLFITGVSKPEIIGRATPNGFLSKPFRINHIEELIEKTLKNTEKPKAKIKNILVVDDDQIFRDMLVETLKYNDYNPISVPDGESALQRLETKGIEAVITDLKMPGIDGLTLLKEIKAKYPELPVVITTAFWDDENIQLKINEASPDGILPKPFTVETVLKLLSNINQPNLN
jgi:CheY-like chemotaxis protein